MEATIFDERNLSKDPMSHALIVMHNIIARKQTYWNAFETKLFLTILSQVKTRTSDNWIVLKKADICDILGIDQTNSSKLRKQAESMVKKSYVQFDGPNEDEWEDGVLMAGFKSTRKDIHVKMNDQFLPLLDELNAHFTQFYLDNVSHFKSKYSILLYQNLKSWFNRNAMVCHKKYSLEELKIMFEIGPDDYRYKRGDSNIFRVDNFKRKSIDVAVKEINADTNKSGMQIGEVTTIYHRNMVAGYDFEYTLIDKQGRVWQPDEQFKKPDQAAQTEKPEPPEGQTTIDDFIIEPRER